MKAVKTDAAVSENMFSQENVADDHWIYMEIKERAETKPHKLKREIGGERERETEAVTWKSEIIVHRIYIK